MKALWIARDRYGYDMYLKRPEKDGSFLFQDADDMGKNIVFESMPPAVFEDVFNMTLEVGESTEAFIQAKETSWPSVSTQL